MSELKVIWGISSEQLCDAGDICCKDWHNEPIPCAYYGAFADEQTFFPPAIKEDSLQRWFFVFDRVPTNDAEEQAAIIAYLT